MRSHETNSDLFQVGKEAWWEAYVLPVHLTTGLVCLWSQWFQQWLPESPHHIWGRDPGASCCEGSLPVCLHNTFLKVVVCCQENQVSTCLGSAVSWTQAMLDFHLSPVQRQPHFPCLLSPAHGPSLESPGLYHSFEKGICTGISVTFLPGGTWASYANFSPPTYADLTIPLPLS